MSSLRLFLECIKEVRRTKKAIKQLKEMDLTEQALQALVNSVAYSLNEVELELKLKDGRTLTFRRDKSKSPISDGFREKFEKRERTEMEQWS